VHLQVSNLGRSLEYYQRIIGLRVEEATDDTAVLTTNGDERTVWRQRWESVVVRPFRQFAEAGTSAASANLRLKRAVQANVLERQIVAP
jgi:hypothetical protein